MSSYSKKTSGNRTPVVQPFQNRTLIEKYQHLKWSRVESSFLKRRVKHERKTDNQKFPVTLVLKNRIRKSCFGRFLSNFNNDQCQFKIYNQNKYEIEKWDYRHSHGANKDDWYFRNDVSYQLIPLIKKAILAQDKISYKYIKQYLEDVRLTNNEINEIDELHKFKKLNVLSLPINWITKVPAKCLPKTLEFLELDTNDIPNLKALCKEKCPNRILHLGLGRNRLTDDSCFHLLGSCNRFRRLHTLDLANNGIMRLGDLLQELRPLTTLTALALEGNPCYTCESYKECILKVFPHLIYLDNTEILDTDREVAHGVNLELGTQTGALTFTCYRLIGIPAPPKGNMHYFYLELKLPLLEEPKPKKVEEVVKEKTGKKGNKEKKGKKDEKKKPAPEKKEKAPKVVKGKGIYAMPDEYVIEEEEKNLNFKTNFAQWAPVIRFNSPAATITAPTNNLLLLRDTLRSRVQVMAIYLQCVKNTKAGKKGPTDILQEVVLKKSTFAVFYCDLFPVNWSEQYIDFIWAACPQITELALPIDGNLKADIYEEGKKAKSAKNKKGQEPLEKVPLPKMITLNVGFGLKRNESVSKKPSKKKI